MANPKRGEIESMFGGQPVRLCLTFGALADLEKRLGLETITALTTRFKAARISANDLIALLVAGLTGGNDPMTENELRNLDLKENWSNLLDTAARLLAATFGDLDVQKSSPLMP